MNNKILRLKKNKDFQKIYEKGQFFAHPLVVIYVLKRTRQGTVRIGFAVGKKVGKAVKRNRVRRQLKEITRLSPLASQFKDCDLILMARKNALLADYMELQEAYVSVEKRALAFLKKTDRSKGEIR